MNNKVILTELERRLINEMNDPLYTVEFIQSWLDRYEQENMNLGEVEALHYMQVRGFYEAIKRVARIVGDC